MASWSMSNWQNILAPIQRDSCDVISVRSRWWPGTSCPAASLSIPTPESFCSGPEPHSSTKKGTHLEPAQFPGTERLQNKSSASSSSLYYKNFLRFFTKRRQLIAIFASTGFQLRLLFHRYSHFKTRGKSYKTFYSHNWQIFISRVLVHGKPFQPSLMFAGKARAYPSEAPFRCSTLGQARGLTHKH